MRVTSTDRPARRRARYWLTCTAATLVLSGCAGETWDQWKRAGLPEAGTAESPLIGNLWIGTWIAAMAVGVLVWGLILWAAFTYRRRDTSLPPQTRYNMPIELLYTIAPFMVIGALFFYTAQNQSEILEVSDEPDLTVGVIGQQWAWTFNYVDEDVYDVGTTTNPTTLYLPVDQTVRFELNSPDLIHSFWVPNFYFKMDVIPGKENVFQVTPNREGTYTGRCAELCGAYHSRMIFEVHVVSQNDFDEHIASLRDVGQTGQVEVPLRGSFSTEPLTEFQPQVPTGKRSER